MLEGHQETGQVVVKSSTYSYLQGIARHAANSSIFSLVGLSKEHLSSSVVEMFEWYADCADKFVADVESGCPLRRDTFRYPFVMQLFEGKTLSYRRMKGSQQVLFSIRPMILEGRGIEAFLWYDIIDLERLDKSLDFNLILRLSESTDIVGIAISCLRSSASLLNLAAKEEDAAMGELTLLSNSQDISYSYDPLRRTSCASLSRLCRPDPVCCHANVRKPGAKDIISSELSHIFPEEVIWLTFNCYIPAAEYNFPRASDNAGRIRNAMMIDRTLPLRLSLFVSPHEYAFTQGECYISKTIGNHKDRSTYGNIQQTIHTARSEAMECLLRQPEETEYQVWWYTNHGRAKFHLQRPSVDIIEAVASTSRGYNTRSGAKRKR